MTKEEILDKHLKTEDGLYFSEIKVLAAMKECEQQIIEKLKVLDRYESDEAWDFPQMEVFTEGDWVKFSDIEAIIKEYE